MPQAQQGAWQSKEARLREVVQGVSPPQSSTEGLKLVEVFIRAATRAKISFSELETQVALVIGARPGCPAGSLLESGKATLGVVLPANRMLRNDFGGVGW